METDLYKAILKILRKIKTCLSNVNIKFEGGGGRRKTKAFAFPT